MEKRLLKGIANPALIAVWVLGILLLIANPSILSSAWFHVKLALVLGISGVHGFYAASQRKFAVGERPRTEKFWRLMNEVPFLMMVIIVILVIVKPF